MNPITGTFTVTPTVIGYAGALCRFTWTSNNASQAFITDIGIVSPNGVKLVYVAKAKTFSITFTDSVDTFTLSQTVSVVNDPSPKIVVISGTTIEVDVARTVQITDFNQSRTPSNGTPFFIIKSFTNPPSPPIVPIFGLSDEYFGVN